MKTQQEKRLQGFAAVKLNPEEMGMLNGGAPVSGGGEVIGGSKWTYQGEMNSTNDKDLLGPGYVDHVSVSDFCGSVTIDGVSQRSGCWWRDADGIWHPY